MTRHRLLALSIPIFALAAGGEQLMIGPITVNVAAERLDVPVEIFGLGSIEARVVSKVGFKLGGALVELDADQGEVVPKSAVLARLDAREQGARVGKATAAVQQAKAALQKAQASVAKAQATLANARRIDQRRAALVANGTVSVETADTAHATLATAEADLQLAQSDVEVAKAGIKDAESQQELEGATLALHTLVAPYDALVVSRQRELGSVLAPGEPVFTLVDADTVWALAYIDESRAGGLSVGQQATVVLRSQPGKRLPGRVARIDIEADRVNEERRVYIAFDQRLTDFHLGEQAEVNITIDRLDRALLVRESAVEDQRGGYGTVWTVEDGHLEQRKVGLGYRLLEGEIEIKGAIPGDGRVVAQPVSGLRVGRSVKIAAESTP
jgi:HlyD family secretion protein